MFDIYAFAIRIAKNGVLEPLPNGVYIDPKPKIRKPKGLDGYEDAHGAPIVFTQFFLDFECVAEAEDGDAWNDLFRLINQGCTVFINRNRFEYKAELIDAESDSFKFKLLATKPMSQVPYFEFTRIANASGVASNLDIEV